MHCIFFMEGRKLCLLLLRKMHDELHITSMSLVLFLLSHSLPLFIYLHTRSTVQWKICLLFSIWLSILIPLLYHLKSSFTQTIFSTAMLVNREFVSMGAAGAWTCRFLGLHLLHPLILRLLVLCVPAVLRPRALQDAPAPADPNS